MPGLLLAFLSMRSHYSQPSTLDRLIIDEKNKPQRNLLPVDASHPKTMAQYVQYPQQVPLNPVQVTEKNKLIENISQPVTIQNRNLTY